MTRKFFKSGAFEYRQILEEIDNEISIQLEFRGGSPKEIELLEQTLKTIKKMNKAKI